MADRMSDPADLGRRLAGFLRLKPGCIYPGDELSRLFGNVDKRRIREAVAWCRGQGDPEVSRIASDNRGYWWAETWDEAGGTDRALRDHAVAILGVCKGFRAAYGRDRQEELAL